MKVTVGQIAALAGGKLVGDAADEITRFSPIEEAGPGSITFLSNPKYAHYLQHTGATAVIIGEDMVPEHSVRPTLIVVKDAYTTLSTLLAHFQSQTRKRGIEQPSYIAPSAQVAVDAYIGAFAYVGENAKVGSGAQIYPHTFLGEGTCVGTNTILHSGVKIYAGCEIGNDCVLHSGAIIGADGFGFAPQPDGTYKKMPQTGIVIIKDNVEIGANTTIDRATMQATVIGTGVKLDNLIQVAHNVEIGEHTVIAAQAGISGSTRIGSHAMIGGQAGIVGHITVADNTKIAAQSGISKHISEEGLSWFGSPALEYKQAMKVQVVQRQLPELLKRLESLEKALKEINDRAE